MPQFSLYEKIVIDNVTSRPKDRGHNFRTKPLTFLLRHRACPPLIGMRGQPKPGICEQ
jgi:hypothetical protein